MEILIIISFASALFPALLILINLHLYRPPPPPESNALLKVSLLIPARDEQARIEPALHAALASQAVDLEVIVLDDHSSDGTAAIVRELAAGDARLRLAMAPELPEGWSGKQYACYRLGKLARHNLLVFTDADVRLTPDALARIAAYLRQQRVDLASGFPRQETHTWAEKLIIPLIHFLLLGFLPLRRMRRSSAPALAAGCGQLIAVKRDAYEAVGGHSIIRTSLHDGVTLPRAFRRAGFKTDLFDATGLATCRMYSNAAELWQGFSKNATEGMATSVGLPVWTVLLASGQVLSFALLASVLITSAPLWMVCATAAAAGLALASRIILATRFRQSWFGVALHPIGILMLLALQWTALINDRRGRPAVWRERTYYR